MTSFSMKLGIGIGAVVVASIYTRRFMFKRRRRVTRIIDTIEELKKPTVHIKNPSHVEDIVCELIRGGASKLQVIADFDMTLSRFHKNGKPCVTTHGALSTSKLMPEYYKEKTQALYNKYYPIETDPNIPFEQKCPLMVQWWEEAHEILVDCGLKKTEIAEIIKNSKTVLRDACDTFFETLHLHDIPVLVFSAGLGDLILEVIRQQASLYKNINVISNFMEFNEDGVVKGFQGETIHIFNKNANACKNGGYFDGLKGRSNVILLGDSNGDITMSEGVPEPATVLKIGFLNDRIDQRLAEYMNMYDIVLVDDQSFDVANGLLRNIL